MKKKIIVPILIILFSFGGFTRIEGANEIKPVLFISILVMGIGIGVLIKSLIELSNDKKHSS